VSLFLAQPLFTEANGTPIVLLAAELATRPILGYGLG